MNNKKLVSIIIPIYNMSIKLKKCVDSVMKQTYNEIEIILINDGSTDDSGTICDEYSIQNGNIKVIHQENKGVSEARNAGIQCAKGEYIFFLDSDDYLDSDVIKVLMDNIEENTLVKISYNVIGKRRKKIRYIDYNKDYENKEFINKILFGDIGGQSWGYLIERKKVQELFFDKNTSCMEDTIYIIECILKSNKIKTINYAFYNHVINEKGITCSNSRIHQNIIDYIYSLNSILHILKLNSIEVDMKNFKLKQFKLIEAELAKCKKMRDFNNIVNSKIISKTLKEILQDSKIDFFKRTYIKLILNKRYYIIKVILEVRRFLKKIKNFI